MTSGLSDRLLPVGSPDVAAKVRDASSDPTRSSGVNVLVAGLYAWVATVGLPALAQPELMARACAAAALLALLVGVALMRRFPLWGRFCTLIGFVGFSAVTWVALGDALSVGRLDPVRAALGGLGWMLFAFGWGAVRRLGSVPEKDPHVIVAEPLAPRASTSLGSTVVFVLAVLLGLAPWFLSWRVVDDGRALLAHAVAFACAVAMIAVGARVSIGLGQARVLPRPGARLNAASSSLAGLLVLGMLGLLLWALSG